jgi:hypothetical protein
MASDREADLCLKDDPAADALPDFNEQRALPSSALAFDKTP